MRSRPELIWQGSWINYEKEVQMLFRKEFSLQTDMQPEEVAEQLEHVTYTIGKRSFDHYGSCMFEGIISAQNFHLARLPRLGETSARPEVEGKIIPKTKGCGIKLAVVMSAKNTAYSIIAMLTMIIASALIIHQTYTEGVTFESFLLVIPLGILLYLSVVFYKFNYEVNRLMTPLCKAVNRKNIISH